MFKSIRSKAFSTLAIPGFAAAMVGAMALAPQAANAASSGTITIDGSVLGSTCSVSTATGGNNDSGFSGGNFTVTLPGVQTTALASNGDTAGATSFSMTLTGCPTSPSGEEVASFFSGTNVNSTDGNLNNTTTSGASNVEIQLLNGDASVIDLTGATAYDQGSAYTAIDGSGNATLSYEAQYIATGASTAGKVTTTVDYTLVYR